MVCQGGSRDKEENQKNKSVIAVVFINNKIYMLHKFVIHIQVEKGVIIFNGKHELVWN